MMYRTIVRKPFNDNYYPLYHDDYAKNNGLDSVGRLFKGHVYCNNCWDGTINPKGETSAELFLINILPYNQHCKKCGCHIVAGGLTMPDLFD